MVVAIIAAATAVEVTAIAVVGDVVEGGNGVGMGRMGQK